MTVWVWLLLTVGAQQAPAADILSRQEAVVAEGKSSIPTLLAGYREMIRKEPGNPEGYVLAAALYPRMESRSLFAKAIEIAPGYAPAHLGLARYWSREESYGLAYAEYQKVLPLLPGNRKVLLETIAAGVKAGRLEEARKLSGDDVESRVEIVHSLIDRNDRAGAERALAEFGFDRDASGAALELRGRLAVMQGSSDALNTRLEAWKKAVERLMNYRYVFPRESVLQALTKAGRRADAIAVARKGIELYPREYPLYEAAWKALFVEVKPDYTAERNAVKAEIEQLLATHPASPELYRVAALGYTMASLPADSDRMNQKLVDEFPYAQAAMWQKRTVAVKEKDLRSKAALLAEVNHDFPNMPMYSDWIKTLDALKVPDAEMIKAIEEYFSNYEYKYLVVYEAAPILLRRQAYLDRLEAWMKQVEKPAGAALDAWDVRILTQKGKLLQLKGKLDEAESTLRGLIGLERQGLSNVDKGLVRFRLGEVLEAQKGYDEALDQYAQGYAQSQHYYAEAGDKFKALYRQVNGGETGMDDFLAIREGMYQIAESVGIERGTRMNKPAPEFNLLTLKGDRVLLASLRGKVVVLNFWATWCGPCIQELPHLEEFYNRNKDKSKIAVLAVTTDENRALVEPFVKKNNYTFTVLFDEGMRPKYEVRGIPTTYIIDPAGNLRVRMVGFNTNEKLVPYLEELVAEFVK